MPNSKDRDRLERSGTQSRPAHGEGPECAHYLESCARLIEATEKDGTAWDIVVCEAGQSKNGRIYSPDVLKAAIPVFEDSPVGLYEIPPGMGVGQGPAKHLHPEIQRAIGGKGLVPNTVGYLENVRWDAGLNALRGVVRLFKDKTVDLRRDLLAAWDAGKDLFGFSINAQGHGREVSPGVVEVREIVSAALDYVSGAAAGGRQLTCLEAEENQMNLSHLLRALFGAGKADLCKRLKTSIGEHPDIKTLDSLEAADAELFKEVSTALGEMDGEFEIPEPKAEETVTQPETPAEPENRITAEPDPAPAPKAEDPPEPEAAPAPQTVGNLALKEANALLESIQKKQWNIDRTEAIAGLQDASIGNAQIALLETQFPADKPGDAKAMGAFADQLRKANREQVMGSQFHHGSGQLQLQEADYKALRTGSEPTDRLLASMVATISKNGRSTDIVKWEDPETGLEQFLQEGVIGYDYKYWDTCPKNGLVLQEAKCDHPGEGLSGVCGQKMGAFRDRDGRPSIKEAAYQIWRMENPNAKWQGSISMLEALTSTSFTGLLRDALNTRVKTDWPMNVWNNPMTGWPAFVSNIKAVSDFRTQYLQKIGGYPDATVVTEGSDYPAAVTPTSEEEVSYAVTKKGVLEAVTMEALRNDQTGEIAATPDRIVRAFARTLFKAVLHDLIGANPTYDGDSTAVIHSDHNNAGVTSAMTEANLEAMRLEIAVQTELDSSEPLALKAALLLFGPSLEETAIQLLVSSYNPATVSNVGTMPVTVRLLNVRPITIPTWVTSGVSGKTIQNDYYMMASPSQVETIEMAFLDGEQAPRVFIDNDPSGGSMFLRDQLTWKVSHIYNGDVAEFRGFSGAIVA